MCSWWLVEAFGLRNSGTFTESDVSPLQVAALGEIEINRTGYLIGAAKSDTTVRLRQRQIPEEDSSCQAACQLLSTLNPAYICLNTLERAVLG